MGHRRRHHKDNNDVTKSGVRSTRATVDNVARPEVDDLHRLLGGDVDVLHRRPDLVDARGFFFEDPYLSVTDIDSVTSDHTSSDDDVHQIPQQPVRNSPHSRSRFFYDDYRSPHDDIFGLSYNFMREIVCRSRRQRREVIFAVGRGGRRGKQRPHRFTFRSLFHC